MFNIESTASGIDRNKLDNRLGELPYITRTEYNNGVSGFYIKQNNYNIDRGNCITVGLDTQTSFYQPISFYTGQNIQIFRNIYMNEYNAVFILAPLKNTLSIFDWGSNGATLKRLGRAKIFLPSQITGEPDYEYMEQYVKNIMIEKLTEYLKFIE